MNIQQKPYIKYPLDVPILKNLWDIVDESKIESSWKKTAMKIFRIVAAVITAPLWTSIWVYGLTVTNLHTRKENYRMQIEKIKMSHAAEGPVQKLFHTLQEKMPLLAEKKGRILLCSAIAVGALALGYACFKKTHLPTLTSAPTPSTNASALLSHATTSLDPTTPLPALKTVQPNSQESPTIRWFPLTGQPADEHFHWIATAYQRCNTLEPDCPKRGIRMIYKTFSLPAPENFYRNFNETRTESSLLFHASQPSQIPETVLQRIMCYIFPGTEGQKMKCRSLSGDLYHLIYDWTWEHKEPKVVSEHEFRQFIPPKVIYTRD